MNNEFMPQIIDPLSEIEEEEKSLSVNIQDEPIDESPEPIDEPTEPIDDSVNIVEVEKPPLIPQQDIFKDAPPPIIKKPKRTRKMNPAALESLAKARAKANETRKKNKEARLKGEMPTPTQKKKIEEEIEVEKKRPVVNNIVHKTENITNNITHDDIQKIVQESTKKTLEDYDLVRKARKEKKKKDNEVATQKQKVRDTIIQAQGLKYGNDGFFASAGCF